MRDRYRLEGLGDAELLSGMSTIVGEGNQVTAHLLAHLAELDERQLYAELGFSSLWAYCVRFVACLSRERPLPTQEVRRPEFN